MFWYAIVLLLIFLIYFSRMRGKTKLIWLGMVLILFSSFRYGIGEDYFLYIEFIVHNFRHAELIPAFIEEIAHKSFPQLFFIITSIIVTCCFLFPVYKKSRSPLMSFFFYLGYPIFFFAHMSTVRQAMGAGFLFFALMIVGNSKWDKIKKGFWIMLAYLCHVSCLAGVFAFYPIERIEKKKIWLCILVSFAIGQIFPFLLLKLLPGGYMQYKLEMYVNMRAKGNMLVSALMYAVTILIMIFHERLITISRKNLRYINWIYLGVILFNLFSINLHMAIRFYAMFASPILLLIPDIIKVLRIPRLAFAGVCILMFALNVWSGEKNNDGKHHFFPYVPVFEAPMKQRYWLKTDILHYYERDNCFFILEHKHPLSYRI